MKQFIALVDANSFYCSAECVFRPDWRNKGIIVTSNNDGVAVAVNSKAKALGIQKFKPYFELKEICDKYGIVVCSSNYELYSSISNSMMNIIGRFAPHQHIYSCDESFLSFKGCSSVIDNYYEHGLKIRRAVWREARLPVCVGIGETLTLSKAANHAAKRIDGYNQSGVCVIDNDNVRIDILSRMPITAVWGCGDRLGKKLQTMCHIETALQLSRMPPKMARQQFGVEMERIVLELNGIPAKHWDEARADKVQIFSTRSVGQRITDIESLNQALVKHVVIAAAKARAQGSACSKLFMFASNSPYDEQSAGIKHLIQFPAPTADTMVMASAVTSALARIYRQGLRYYKVGIGLLDLSPNRHTQLDLFNDSKDNPEVMRVLDQLNDRFGKDTLFLGGQGIDPKWAMRRQMLSPQYTTRWRDLPKLKC
jgi:DNA polymerase V